MKTLFFFLLVCVSGAYAQDCQQILKNARNEAQKGNYQLAIAKYTTAINCDKNLQETVNKELSELFRKIENDRIRAEKAEKKATEAKIAAGKVQEDLETTLLEVRKQKESAESNLKTAEMFRQKSDASLFRAAVLAKHTAAQALFEKKNKTEFNFTKIKFASITQLNFDGWGINRLPEDIVKCQNLQNLNLSNNGEMDIIDAFQKISSLKKLQIIELHFSGIKNLPVQIGELENLQSLDLSFNKLNNLPSEIGNLKNLKKLNLKYNPISENEQKRIKELLPTCQIEFSESYADKATLFVRQKNYQEAFNLQQKVINQDPENYISWFNYSLYALFVGKPQEAIWAAEKTLELNPDEVRVETNLALGYLLNNQYAEAEKIYLKWKGKIFPDSDILWDEAFLQDIQIFEKAAIKHPDFEKVRKLFGK